MQNWFIAYLQDMYYQFKFCTDYTHVTARHSKICNHDSSFFLVLPDTIDQSTIRKHPHEFIRNSDIMEICLLLIGEENVWGPHLEAKLKYFE